MCTEKASPAFSQSSFLKFVSSLSSVSFLSFILSVNHISSFSLFLFLILLLLLPYTRSCYLHIIYINLLPRNGLCVRQQQHTHTHSYCTFFNFVLFSYLAICFTLVILPLLALLFFHCFFTCRSLWWCRDAKLFSIVAVVVVVCAVCVCMLVAE